jgi:glutathione S-transferase
MGSNDSEIVLYNSRRCPWAHRAHVALTELNISFREEIVDLDKPRTPEYLAINPRGLVPSVLVNGHILTESAIVAQFFADREPTHLVPTTGTEEAALKRARIAFFADTYNTKVQTHNNKITGSKDDAEAEEYAQAGVAGIVKEIEPLLADAGPFFGGSEKFTLAEVLVGPFIARLVTLTEEGVWPSSYVPSLQKQAPNFWKWATAVANHPSLVEGYGREDVIRLAKQRAAKARAQSQ